MQNSLSSFYALYFCQTSNGFTTKSSTSNLEAPEKLSSPLHAALCVIWLEHPTKYKSGFFTSTLLLIEFLFSFTHIHRGIIYRESDTHIPWYLILCIIVVFSKISATIVPSVVPKSSKLLVIYLLCLKRCHLFLRSKDSFLVNSESLLLHVVKSESLLPHVVNSESLLPHVVKSESLLLHVVNSESLLPHVVNSESLLPNVVNSESLLLHVAIKCMGWLSFYLPDQYGILVSTPCSVYKQL